MKADYKENIIELDQIRNQNRKLRRDITISEKKSHDLSMELESLQAQYDKLAKNNFENEYLQLLSENKKLKIENSKLNKINDDKELLIEALSQEVQSIKIDIKEGEELAISDAEKKKLEPQIPEAKAIEDVSIDLSIDTSQDLTEIIEEDSALSLDEDLILDAPQEDLTLEEVDLKEIVQEEEIIAKTEVRTPELRTLVLDDDDDLLDDDLCLNEDLESEASDSQEDLLELSNEPIWQVKGVDALTETYTLLEMKEFREHGQIREATFIKKIGEWWKRYTDHYELLIPITPMKLGDITKIYLKKESLRIPMNELIQTYIGDVFSHGEILNLSMGGCQIKMNKSLEHLFTNGRELRIDFNEGSLLSGIKIKGIIRRVEPEGQQFICGIQFIELDGDNKIKVEELISSNSTHLNLTAA
jgi:hypothetical protein